MNWSAGKIGAIFQEPAHAIGLSTPPIGCVLDLPGLPGGGNKIYDRSPYGNHGTITGAVWKRLPSGLWVPDLDGNDDYITCSTVLDVAPTNVSFEFWFSPTDNWSAGSGSEYLLSKSNIEFQDDFAIYLTTATGALRFTGEYNNEGAVAIDSAQTSWVGGVFYYIVCTFDGTQRMYINGVMEADTDTPNGFMRNGTFHDLHIGCYHGLGNNFKGKMALIRIYSRALSALEIQNHFNREKHLFGVW